MSGKSLSGGKQLLWHQLAILVVGGVVLLANLGGPKLWDRDEPRNAGCAWEMLERGDWVTPYFNAELRDHKPVLLYWLMMASYSLLGVNEFSARLPSALLALGTALCTYHIGRRLYRPTTGLWAGMILCTSLMFGVAGRAATPDSPLIFCVALAMLMYVLATFAPRDDAEAIEPPKLKAPGQWFPTSWAGAAGIYAAMGLAVLAKGPVGLVLPTAILGMFLLIMRLPERKIDEEQLAERGRLARFGYWLVGLLRPFAPLHFLKTCWAMRPLTAIAVAAAVALPWYVWVHVRSGGAFTEGFFFTHNYERATQSFEGHSGGVLFYPVAILVGFFPWSAFALGLVLMLVRQIRGRDAWWPAQAFMLCWIGVQVGAFTLAGTKLPSYVTPCYPALALLCGSLLDRWFAGALAVGKARFRMAFLTPGIVGLVILIGIPLAAKEILPGETSWGIAAIAAVGAIPLVGSIACLWLLRKEKPRAAGAAYLAMSVAFTTAIFAGVADHISHQQRYGEILAAIDATGESPRVGAYAHLEPTWVFYGRRPVNFFTDDKAEEARAFLTEGDNGYLLITRDSYETLAPTLPPDVKELASVPYFLRDRELLLIGRGEGRVASDGGDAQR